MTEIHITADTEFWTGASTRALQLARIAGDAWVVCGLTSEMRERYAKAGIKTEFCKVGGWLGALNLSRALRRIPGEAFKIYVHSPELRPTVESALQLVGRREPMELIGEMPEIPFPAVDIERGNQDGEPLYMWLGNIKAGCTLGAVIERLGQLRERPWRLRVVGQGKAADAVPLLKRAKALDINDRIEWVGYSQNPYAEMAGVTAGLVGEESTAAREFRAAGIPVISNLEEL